MHAAVCLLHAGQLNRAGDVAKSGEFLGEFSWVELFPMDVRGLIYKTDSRMVDDVLDVAYFCRELATVMAIVAVVVLDDTHEKADKHISRLQSSII